MNNVSIVESKNGASEHELSIIDEKGNQRTSAPDQILPRADSTKLNGDALKFMRHRSRAFFRCGKESKTIN